MKYRKIEKMFGIFRSNIKELLQILIGFLAGFDLSIAILLEKTTKTGKKD